MFRELYFVNKKNEFFFAYVSATGFEPQHSSGRVLKALTIRPHKLCGYVCMYFCFFTVFWLLLLWLTSCIKRLFKK